MERAGKIRMLKTMQSSSALRSILSNLSLAMNGVTSARSLRPHKALAGSKSSLSVRKVQCHSSSTCCTYYPRRISQFIAYPLTLSSPIGSLRWGKLSAKALWTNALMKRWHPERGRKLMLEIRVYSWSQSSSLITVSTNLIAITLSMILPRRFLRFTQEHKASYSSFLGQTQASQSL